MLFIFTAFQEVQCGYQLRYKGPTEGKMAVSP